VAAVGDAVMMKENVSNTLELSGRNIKTVSNKTAHMNTNPNQFSSSYEMTEDEMLFLALEESAKIHQVSIGSETCSNSFRSESKSGMQLLQLPIVNQFHPQWNPLISKYSTPSAICGYTAIACARFIAALESPVTKSELQLMLSTMASVSGPVEDAMRFVHDSRRDYIAAHPADFTTASSVQYMKSWVANYEISDYLRRECPPSLRHKLAFVRFNQFSQLHSATHEERDRISAHESGFDDAEILIETFHDSDMLASRPHFHRPSETKKLPALSAAVVDVNGHFACAALCKDGCVLFNTMDSSCISFPGSETTAVAFLALANKQTEEAS
jgi:hypothetical protein